LPVNQSSKDEHYCGYRCGAERAPGESGAEVDQ
jgi:hypothetical protein